MRMNRLNFTPLWRPNDAGGEDADGERITVHTRAGAWVWFRRDGEGRITDLLHALQTAASPEDCSRLLLHWETPGNDREVTR